MADTPGFSAINFDGMTANDIRDNFIEFNEYNLLNDFGEISNKIMKDKVDNEYEIFNKERKIKQKIEADKEDLKELEKFEKENK